MRSGSPRPDRRQPRQHRPDHGAFVPRRDGNRQPHRDDTPVDPRRAAPDPGQPQRIDDQIVEPEQQEDHPGEHPEFDGGGGHPLGER